MSSFRIFLSLGFLVLIYLYYFTSIVDKQKKDVLFPYLNNNSLNSIHYYNKRESESYIINSNNKIDLGNRSWSITVTPNNGKPYTYSANYKTESLWSSTNSITYSHKIDNNPNKYKEYGFIDCTESITFYTTSSQKYSLCLGVFTYNYLSRYVLATDPTSTNIYIIPAHSLSIFSPSNQKWKSWFDNRLVSLDRNTIHKIELHFALENKKSIDLNFIKTMLSNDHKTISWQIEGIHKNLTSIQNIIPYLLDIRLLDIFKYNPNTSIKENLPYILSVKLYNDTLVEPIAQYKVLSDSYKISSVDITTLNNTRLSKDTGIILSSHQSGIYKKEDIAILLNQFMILLKDITK